MKHTAFQSKTRYSSGYTLIELIVALVIASTLMIAVMGTVSRLSRHRNALEDQYRQNTWILNLRNVFESDYKNSQSILVRPDQIAMITCRSTHSTEKGNSQLPAAVVYQIKTIGSDNFLVRLEKSLIEKSDRQVVRTLVAAGIRRIEIEQRVNTDIPLPAITLKLTRTDGETLRLGILRHGVFE